MMIWRRAALFVISALAAALTNPGLAQPDVRPILPGPTGKYGMGRVAYQFALPPTLPSAEVKRIMVHVWYPTEKNAAGKEADYIPFLNEVAPTVPAGDLKDIFSLGEYKGAQSLPETGVLEGPRIAPGMEKFPLLIFSHGWGNPTFIYTAELRDLVSNGYIVAAIEHPGDTGFTRFPDGSVAYFAQKQLDAASAKPGGFREYFKERVKLMAEANEFALTKLIGLNRSRNTNVPFRNRIDLRNIGAFGHSIGGHVAATQCQTDRRIKACMNQDSTDYRGSPFGASSLDQVEKQPFLLFVVNSADIWSAKALNPSEQELAHQKMSREEFLSIMKQQQQTQLDQLSRIAGGAYLVKLFDLPGMTHRSFSDQPLLASAANDAVRTVNVHNFQVIEGFNLSFWNRVLKADANGPPQVAGGLDVKAEVTVFENGRQTPHR
jgi:platelet-activating factor acetylhydrolase isoform II